MTGGATGAKQPSGQTASATIPTTGPVNIGSNKDPEFLKGVAAGYCEGLHIGWTIGKADGRNNNSAHAIPNMPQEYEDIINECIDGMSAPTRQSDAGSSASGPNQQFDNGVLYELLYGYADGYALGNAAGKAEFAQSIASGAKNFQGTSADNQQFLTIASQFYSLESRWCLGQSMASPPTPSSALASISAAEASYPPEIVAAFKQIEQQLQADGYVSADDAGSADAATEVAALGAEGAAMAGQDPEPEAQDANEAACITVADAGSSQGLGDEAAQDAESEAEQADSA